MHAPNVDETNEALHAPARGIAGATPGTLVLVGIFFLNRERVLVTFAFGHCGTVCPTLVHDLLAARARGRHLTLPLVIVTLDP